MSKAATFLSARWRSLLMFNYEIDAARLTDWADGRSIPRGTVLDRYHGKAYISVVAFMFLDTRLLGVPVPFHRNFEEINLRFYVRREEAGRVKRGVVFIKEIVRRRAVSTVARWAYNENYVTLPMSHRIDLSDGELHPDSQVEYRWQTGDQWNHAKATVTGSPAMPDEGSLEQFITEHYWGYGTDRRGRTIEYQVEHPPWRIWPVADASLACDVATLYGESFSEVFEAEPRSVLVADGSPVLVRRPRRIE